MRSGNNNGNSFGPTSEETVDAFFRGGFFLVQPKHGGHKAGLDALLVASVIPEDFQGRVADFGSGAGAAGLAVAARCKNTNITLIEYGDVMAEYAKKTLNLAGNQWLAERVKFVQADVTLKGRERQQIGLKNDSFDFVIMNPPFNDPSDRATPYNVRAEAHIMAQNMFAQWLRTAAAMLKPGGQVAIIARPRSLEELFLALKGRFGALRVIFIHARPKNEAIRIIIVGKKGSRAPLSVLPSHFIHDDAGRHFNQKTDAIVNGKQTIFD